MAPHSHVPVLRVDEHQGINLKIEDTFHGDHGQIKGDFLLAKRTKNLRSACKMEKHAVYREKDALIRQQNAKARGEAAIGRILRSKAAEHKTRAFELDVLGDLVYVRVSELLDQCSTSTSNQHVMQCNILH